MRITPQELLQGLVKLLAQCCSTTIVGQQQQLKLLNNGGWLEIQLVQLNIQLQTAHIQEETRAVRMRGVKMMGLKVLSTWQGKLPLLKVDLDVTGIDIGRCKFCADLPTKYYPTEFWRKYTTHHGLFCQINSSASIRSVL